MEEQSNRLIQINHRRKNGSRLCEKLISHQIPMRSKKMSALIDLTCHFLALLSQQPGQNDPRITELETRLRARDSKALALMRELQLTQGPVALICTAEMIEAVREELGAAIQTDHDCLAALTRLKAASTRPKTQQLLERAINFVKIPPGTELDSEPPFLDLITVLDEFSDPDELMECIKYMGTMIDPSAA